ncbi:prolyl endopeptidase isoform X2 [Leptopilina heterotoma]|uniref:prolyl endopeptidase isoform X2 n=1 Tax=Leptopilina heterotoma TaxID=63436 RepID=UPI001CA99AEB|nr:prolyl endopeptidase isoform X2 [Leptopilina heterotoma]
MARFALCNSLLLFIAFVSLLPKQEKYGSRFYFYAIASPASSSMLTGSFRKINHRNSLLKTVTSCIKFENINYTVSRNFLKEHRDFAAVFRSDFDIRNNKSMPSSAIKFKYPEARRDNTVDNYHGAEVADPYRWLEDPDSEETKAFVESQNAITTPYLTSCSAKSAIHDRLKQMWDFPKYSCPARHGNKYYFYKNDGLQNQRVLYVQDTLDSEPRIFLDPNTLSPDGTISIAQTKFSEDGNIFAYGLSESGSDWNKIHFMNTKTGEKYPEVLEQVKYSSISWTHDNVGIFYGRYPHQISADGSETDSSHNQKLFYHRVGTPQSEDILVVEFPENPLWRISAEVSDCGKWLFVLPMQDCKDNLVYFTELKSNEEIKGKFNLTQIVNKMEADYDYITNDGTKAIFRTNKNAPNSKLIAIDLLNYEEENWTVLLPEHSHNVLDWAAAVDNDKVLACYIEDVKSVLQLHSLKSGELIRNFPLDVGTVSGFSGEKKYSEIFYHFTSILNPGIIYTMDLKKDENPKILREIKVDGFNPSLYTTIQVFYTSKDGTKIPMFIAMKKGAKLDGSMPALLYGYGGFNISLLPEFSVTRLIFIQHLNGILAIPNIRGGGEYGEKWHNDGKLFKKQNTFDDFQSAAEYLIEHGYTSSKKLSIQGGSNGGLLIGACVNQRPDLFGAAIAQVGVMDMLRFHKFTIGYAWASDYGNSDDSKHFQNLIKFSPLHNIKTPKDGHQYPAIMVLSADHDDRVVPLHSLKYIATIQHVLGELPQQTNPLLGRFDVKAGHGSGKSTSKVIEELSDILTFIVKSLGLEFKL